MADRAIALTVLAVAATLSLAHAGTLETLSLNGFKRFGSSMAKASNYGLFSNPSAFGDEKIIGGSKSSISRYPFAASISIANGKTLQLNCGGSVLDEYHILTAAHCVYNFKASTIRVRVGSDKWRYRGQLVSVAQTFIHPKYNKKTIDYDVAVARLAKPLQLGKTAKAVRLVRAGTAVRVNTPITLIGWGYTDALHAAPPSPTLRSVNINTIDRSECNADYTEYSMAVTSRMFCGMSDDGSKSSCQGDSGGPVINFETGEQIGIVSWAMGCAQMGSPGVFTDLANKEIRSFIDQSRKK